MSKNNQKRLLASYLIGFVLSVILMVMAFNLVVHHQFAAKDLYFGVAILALVQLLVQCIFFLRLSARSLDDKWNLICFIFTVIIILIVVTGSLWIMYNLNYYMVN